MHIRLWRAGPSHHGVEQEPGAKKRHLNTREFKQQQEALNSLEKEAQAVTAELEQRRLEESELAERLRSYERQAQEAEKELAAQSDIPAASMFNYKSALEAAQEIIERQKKALAAKNIIVSHNEKLQAEIKGLRETTDGLNTTITRLITEKEEEEKRNSTALRHWIKQYEKAAAQLENIEKFFRWNPEANTMHLEYIQQQREEARKQEAERQQKALEREREAQREKGRREAGQARELERQEQEREQQKAQWLERRSRGMGMGR